MVRTSATSRKKIAGNVVAPTPAVLAVLARFRVIFQTNRQHYQHIQESVALGGSQLQALAIIAEHPRTGISALGKAMMVRQPTASNLVEQLVRLGHVRKQKNSRDLRAIELTITPKARALLARAPGPIVGLLADAISALSPKDVAKLRASLDAVLHVMKERDDSARFRPLADL